MGAHMDDIEKVALLPYQTVPELGAAVAASQPIVRTWNGHLLNCCHGAGDAAVCWGSCLMSYFVPCLAFGHNMKKALRLSFLAQAVAFGLFFFSGKFLYLWSSQAVAASCPPMHHGPHDHHGHGHHHPNPMVADLPTSMMPGSFSPNSTVPDHPDQPPHMNPECQKALIMMNGLFFLAVLLAFSGVVYAARRRTQMRESFGIAGTRMNDFCSWLCCPLCALCQETRTLWSNNVHEGVWYGPTQLLAPTQPAMQAPLVNEMEVDFAKPVNAKDFV